MKLISKSFLTMVAAVTLLTTMVAQPTAHATTYPNLVQMLERDGRFNTLLAALDAADLKSTVASGGVFTVIAPTDAAFAKIPADQLNAIISNKPLLTDILLYHVLGGRQYSWSLLAASTATTLEGNPLLITRDGLKVTINNQRVLQANVFAGNGLIHAVDGVLLPPTADIQVKSIIDVLKLDGRFTTLLAAINAAGLTDVVATAGVFTVFAPTDAAFSKLPAGTIPALLNDIPTLTDVLLYHVLGGRYSSPELLLKRTAKTLEGSDLQVSLRNWVPYVNDSRIQNPNVKAPNGMIHVIESVLLPPAPQPNLVELLEADGRFSILLTALELTGLKGVVATGGTFTVFAPTDAAFGALPAGTVDALVANPEQLKKILLYHVVDGERRAGFPCCSSGVFRRSWKAKTSPST